MRSYMSLIYIDDEDNARQTNMQARERTNALTWKAFKSYRSLEVDIKTAKFLLDYHKGNDDLCDTIALDASGFEQITGQKPKTDAEYVKIDDDYWAEARADYAQRKKAA
jgi:hypothetical protein